MHLLFGVLMILLLVGVAVGFGLQQRLYRRLNSEHPRALEILAESGAGIMAFQRYLWKRQYLGLHDGAFTLRADFLRRYWTIWFLLFLSIVVVLVVAVDI